LIIEKSNQKRYSMKPFNLLNQKSLVLSFIIAIVFSSCSMVKSGDVNNFNRVKYHPHMKGVKLTKTDKVNQKPSIELTQAEIKEYHTKKLERTTVNENQLVLKGASVSKGKKSIAENKTSKASKRNADNTEIIQNENRLDDFLPSIALSGLSNWTDLLPVKRAMLNPAPVASDSAIGGLIWLLLVILLVLVILSILAELGGGVIGTLVAVLLILLILSLLGII